MKKGFWLFVFCLLAARGAAAFDAAAELGGKTVGVQLGTTADVMLTDAENVRVERYNKAGDAVQSLLRGKIDAVMIDEQPAKAFVALNDGLTVPEMDFDTEHYAIAVSKKNPELKRRINAALKALTDDGTIGRIVKNHIGDEKGAHPFTPRSAQASAGVLKIATNATFPPYEFYEQGEIRGIDIDLAKAVADRLGLRPVIEDMEFDAIIGAVQSGKADIGVAGMTVTPDRLKNIDFSVSYTTSKQVLIVRAAAEKAEARSGLTARFENDFLTDARWKYLLSGLGNTLIISLFAALTGVVFGGIIGIVRVAHDKNGSFPVLNFLCRIYLTVVRGTPAVIQLLIMYYVVFAALDVHKLLVATVAFGLNSAAYVAEIVRSGILSVDNGQNEAGRSLGLDFSQTMRFVILPQAFKNVLPALANEFIVLIKETSICGYIGLTDLTRGGDIIRSITYDAFMPLAAVAAIYLTMVLALTAGVSRLEKRLKRNER